MKAKLIKTDGTTSEVEPIDKEVFTLQELYDHIGCDMVQFIYLRDTIMVIDEEGKLENKPYNKDATLLASEVLFPGDYIVGNVLLCNPLMLD